MTILTLREASIKADKSQKTIRRAIKDGRLSAQMEGSGWTITLEALEQAFGPIQSNDKSIDSMDTGGHDRTDGGRGADMGGQREDKTPDIASIIAPLMDRIAYYDNELERTRLMLDSGREEKERIKEKELATLARFERERRWWIYAVAVLVVFVLILFLKIEGFSVTHI